MSEKHNNHEFVVMADLIVVVVVGILAFGSCSDANKRHATTMDVTTFVESGTGETCDIDVMAGLRPVGTISNGTKAVMAYTRRAWWAPRQCETGDLVIVDLGQLAYRQDEHRKEEAGREAQANAYRSYRNKAMPKGEHDAR